MTPIRLETPAEPLAGVWLGAALAPPALVVLLASLQPFVDPRLLFIDAAEARAETCCAPYLGILSNAGVTMLCIASAAALLACVSVRASRRARRATALAAIFSAWLAVDDSLMLHEYALPAAGLAERAVMAGYGVVAFVCLEQRRVWMRPQAASLLPLAVLMLAASAGIDAVFDLGQAMAPAHWQAVLVTPMTMTMGIVVEDGAKFVGLWLWMICHLNVR